MYANTTASPVQVQQVPLLPAANGPQQNSKTTGLKKPSRLSSPLSYCIAQSQPELHEAFELVHQSYLNAGLVQANGSELRVTPHQRLPTTEVFVTRYEGQVVSTVSLVGDGKLGLPMESMYGNEIQAFRDRGLKMAEIGCLADRRESPIRFIETFATMGRLLAMVAMDRGYDGLVVAARPKHTKLYRRILPFQQVGKIIECPYANGVRGAMIYLTFEEHRGTSVYDRFFGDLGSALDIAPRPWSEATRTHFEQFLAEPKST